MDKRFLAIFSEGVSVKKRGERLVLEKPDKKISVLVKEISALLIFGSANFTGSSLNLLLSEDIPAFLFTRFGKLKGIIHSGLLGSNYNNRLEQYELFKLKRLEIAKFFVLKKLEQIEIQFKLNLGEFKEKLKQVKTLDEVRGIEGNASKIMFDEVKKMLEKTPFKFEGRNYYPPKDEINALLSLTYTLIYAMSFSVVLALGFDPYISFLHSKRGTHASFCSDIMEITRPFATKELIQKVKARVFKKEDFETQNGKGVYLTSEGLNKLLNFVEGISEKIFSLLGESIGGFTSLGEELK